MSSGYLVCFPCKVFMGLGRAIPRTDGRVWYFKAGPHDGPQNLYQAERNRALWKMLADHCGHPLEVVVDGQDTARFDAIGLDFVRIGGDLTFEEYLKGWPG